MDERAVFLKFELFAKRLNKLIDMFTTIYQFSSLEQHTHIAGECCNNDAVLARHMLQASLHSCLDMSPTVSKCPNSSMIVKLCMTL